METNLARILNDIETIARFTSTPGAGSTRYTYSPEYLAARRYVIAQMTAIGLTVREDGIGNVRARLEGTDPALPAIMAGSHLDTVTHGGAFDGVAGVVTALEAARVLKETRVCPRRPIEVVIFVEEEGASFGGGLVGSKVLAGQYTQADLKGFRNHQGLSMFDAARRAGFAPERVEDGRIQPGTVGAMLELHIEQSLVLDSEQLPIGLVGAIAGRQWLEVEIRGTANHAGATPMNYRHDPMAGAARVIAAIETIVRRKALPSTVATVGRIWCSPNAANVIPERVGFTLDVRDVHPEGIEVTVTAIKDLLTAVTARRGLQWAIRGLSQTDPVRLSPRVTRALERILQEKGLPYRPMNSGALHDAGILAGVTEVGMIFVPSVAGRSHCPEEFTAGDDLKIGADLLLNAIYTLAAG